tara:strand:+ start:337 stop:606 length:270 start_codon:yes stop_codon:yes gene_type:complete
MEKIMYTKHDLTQTDKYEEVNIDNAHYKKTFKRLLNKVADDILGNVHSKLYLMFYMERYYYSYEHRETDALPIDTLYDEFDPDREYYKL